RRVSCGSPPRGRTFEPVVRSLLTTRPRMSSATPSIPCPEHCGAGGRAFPSIGLHPLSRKGFVTTAVVRRGSNFFGSDKRVAHFFVHVFTSIFDPLSMVLRRALLTPMHELLTAPLKTRCPHPCDRATRRSRTG